MTQDMGGLIERLEAASGPDRELDEAIADALFPAEPFVQLADAPPGTGFRAWRQDGHVQSALRYTASIDAALTLVPEGWAKNVIDCDNGDALVELWTDTLSSAARAKTWPIALCLAALKAREQ